MLLEVMKHDWFETGYPNIETSRHIQATLCKSQVIEKQFSQPRWRKSLLKEMKTLQPTKVKEESSSKRNRTWCRRSWKRSGSLTYCLSPRKISRTGIWIVRAIYELGKTAQKIGGMEIQGVQKRLYIFHPKIILSLIKDVFWKKVFFFLDSLH